MLCSAESLCFRRNEEKTSLQICWFAATANNFIGSGSDKVSREAVNAVDIVTLCDDIQTGFLGTKDRRFSLYYSAQLMYGAVKIFQEQTKSTNGSCENLFNAFATFNLDSQENRKKTLSVNNKNAKAASGKCSESTIPELSEIDIVGTLSKGLTEDIHLIPEVYFPTYNQMEELSFGFSQLVTRGSTQVEDEVIRQLHLIALSQDAELPITSTNNNVHQHEPTIANTHLNVPEDQAEYYQSNVSEKTNVVDQEPQTQSEDIHGAKNSRRKLLRASKKRISAKYGIPQEPLFSSSESAQTASSPPVKRTVRSPVAQPATAVDSPLSKKRKMPASAGLDHDVTMTEPVAEAAVPCDLSSSQLPLETATPPQVPLDALDDHDVPMLPNTNLQRSRQLDTQSEIESIKSASQGMPPQLKIAVNKNTGKRRRGKKAFADIVKQIKLVERDINVCTRTKEEVIKINLYERESAEALLTLQSHNLMRKGLFHANRILWSNQLLSLFNEHIQTPCKKLAKESEAHFEAEDANIEEVHYSPHKIPAKEIEIIPQHIHISAKEISKPEDNVPDLPHISNSPESMDYSLQPEEQVDNDAASIGPDRIDKQPEDLPESADDVLPIVKKFKTKETGLELDLLITEANSHNYSPLADFFAIVQIFWNKVEKTCKIKNMEIKIAFQEVVSPDSNCVNEVIIYLMHCLYLEQGKKMYLEQEKPYALLYLVKP